MNISNINNFIKVKNDILKWFAHAVAQATDISIARARIYRWQNEWSEFLLYWQHKKATHNWVAQIVDKIAILTYIKWLFSFL